MDRMNINSLLNPTGGGLDRMEIESLLNPARGESNSMQSLRILACVV